jgi:hypothetical protein
VTTIGAEHGLAPVPSLISFVGSLPKSLALPLSGGQFGNYVIELEIIFHA